ncbi:unnamed protein product [Acanthoscelides obtectus]|uniref:C2H2-type domain-containing protein n=1 Tax=Acanthoscelides obtectus TaxID=200917 RepID=A0A9P0M9P8_ACAOB|nr:unnamed protein product [Acanthoscelides obtectus]CAK1630748.1 Zinc finger protein 26 [Acanthoscelides obtectus]
MIHQCRVEKSDTKVDDILIMKTEHAIAKVAVEEPSIKSIKREHWDRVNQVKTESELVVVKSEKPNTEVSVDMKFEDTLTLKDIKSAYDEYDVSDLTWHRIKNEQMLDLEIEGHLTVDTVHQMKMEFQESEKLEEKTPLSSTHFENTDALGLHEEFDIKVESDQNEGHDSATNSAQRKNMWKREQTYSQIEEKKLFSCICNYTNHSKNGLILHIKNNCHLGSNLKKSPFVSRKLSTRNEYVCVNCKEVFKLKASLYSHMARNHAECIASKSSTIHECMFCDFKTVHKSHLTGHLSKHTKPSDTHICKCCSISFKTKVLLYDHTLKKHPIFNGIVSSEIYECMYCSFKTTDRSTFIRHMAKHNTQNPFECTNCYASFKSKVRLDDHILEKHAKFTASVSHKIQECTQCEYKTTFAYSLAKHIAKHTGAKPTCTRCDASFIKKVSFENHILQKHPEITDSVSSKIYECTHCEYRTTGARYLAVHIMKHTGDKFTCTKCDASFTSKEWLDNHILQKHPEFTASVSRKIHECTQCEYKTAFAYDLARHITKHTGAKNMCTKCDASFTSKQWLDNHILQKHPEFTASVSRKIYECTDCEYKSLHKQQLTMHMVKHTGAKLTCTKCDASFISNQSLDNHVLHKHPEFADSVSCKIHKCTHCEFKTTHSGNLASHIKKHTGTKLTCTKCDASFTFKRTLDNHILQNHSEFTDSVSFKVHECTYCEYKTTHAQNLDRHIIKHTGAKITCTKCDASFTFKRSLDNHILRTHSELAGSVSFKIHKCTHCEYKTTFRQHLAKHVTKHTRSVN